MGLFGRTLIPEYDDFVKGNIIENRPKQAENGMISATCGQTRRIVAGQVKTRFSSDLLPVRYAEACGIHGTRHTLGLTRISMIRSIARNY